MKKFQFLAVVVILTLVFTSCDTVPNAPAQNPSPIAPEFSNEDITEIILRDGGIKIDGTSASTDTSNSVFIGNDIIYYEEGKDFTYGEGTADDAHSAESAAEHTVVHISKAGIYSVCGSLSKGQIAIDLGSDAKEDPAAVVTLILKGVDLSCEVAPAIIFYNVYECGSPNADSATKDVDTSPAGANIIIADDTQNTVNGSYVARIYDPDSVILSDDGTEVEDAKKLHKYDGALYSKMSMNLYGGEKNNGILTINAKNEGLDSELHLTLNGGIININSGNDGINTNEDGVSVTTVNGGELNIKVTGETGEGDGIDSNGWLVINGGTVTAQACSFSADAGIDSDMGIHINGGTVVAYGHMLDRIEDSGQSYVIFSFDQNQSDNTFTLKHKNGKTAAEFSPQNDYTIMLYSSHDLSAGTYTLWNNKTQLSVQSVGIDGFDMQGNPGMRPGVNTPPDGFEFPDAQKPSEGFEPPESNEPPEGFEAPNGNKPPDGFGRPDDNIPNKGGNPFSQEALTEFQIIDGGNMFRVLAL